MPTTDASAGVEAENAVLNAKIKKQVFLHLLYILYTYRKQGDLSFFLVLRMFSLEN